MPSTIQYAVRDGRLVTLADVQRGQTGVTPAGTASWTRTAGDSSWEVRGPGLLQRHHGGPRTDQWGDESVHLYVVYDGDGEPLDAGWLGGLRNRMRRELRSLGVTGVVTTSYIDRSELDPWLDLTASGHLIDCIAEQQDLKTPETDFTEHGQSLHLSVHDGSGLYRLELAVRADTTLRHLDKPR